MLKFAVMAAWVFATAPIVGVFAAALSGFVIAVSFELIRFVIGVVRIYRDPLSFKPDKDFFNYF